MKKDTPRKVTLIEQVKQKIKVQIATAVLHPGDRIDSTRGIVKRYNVSHVTAVTALRELNEEGWIDAKVGSGSYVSQEPPINTFKHQRALPDASSLLSQIGNLYFIFNKYPYEQNSYHGEVLCYLQDMVERNSWNLKVCLAQDGPAILSALNDPMNIGIIHDSTCGYLFTKNTEITCIEYGMSPFLTGTTGVYPDNFAGGFQAGCYLFEKGHINVKFVNITPKSLDYGGHHFMERYNGLCLAAEKYGRPAPEICSWHIKSKDTQRQVIDILEKIKSGNNNIPSALVVGNKSMASEIYLMATGMGVRIPEDISMLTFIERPGSEPFPISHFDISGRAIAIEIINLLERHYANAISSTLRVLLPMILNEQGSVKSI